MCYVCTSRYMSPTTSYVNIVGVFELAGYLDLSFLAY